MADWGFKISQDGKDVKTCTDDELVMSSEFDMLKTKVSASVTATPNEFGVNNVVIAHGLSYTPVAFVAKKLGTNDYGLIGQSSFAVSSQNLTINGNPLATEYFRYYIFYERLVI